MEVESELMLRKSIWTSLFKEFGEAFQGPSDHAIMVG